MPVIVRWFDLEKTIIIQEIQGQWTVKEFLEETVRAEIRLEADVYKPQYFIVDLSGASTIPGGILSYRDQYDAVVDPQSITVFVAANGFVRVIVQTMQRLGLKGGFHFAGTIDHALAIIDEYKYRPESNEE